MVIQIIPKQQERSSSLANILLYLAVVLLLVVSVSYFILNNFLQKTEKNIDLLDKDLAAAATLTQVAQETEILDYQKKIADFSSLLASHRYSSQIFSLVESVTHPKVVFLNFALDASKKSIALFGTTDSFQTLGQQLVIFKNEKLIKETNLSNIAFSKEGKISFNFNLVLDPQIFIKK